MLLRQGRHYAEHLAPSYHRRQLLGGGTSHLHPGCTTGEQKVLTRPSLSETHCDLSASLIRQISIAFASRVATFHLPSLSSIFDALLPAPNRHQLALANVTSDLAEAKEEEEQDALEWDGYLNAVPKSKVSHSRKAMRSANKGLKDRVGECSSLDDRSLNYSSHLLLLHRLCTLCVMRSA